MFFAKDRQYSFFDKVLMHFDQGVQTLLGSPVTTGRENPAEKVSDSEMTQTEKKHVAGLMRVNHAGEVAAQGLYQGQALAARSDEVKQKMMQCALEENDHLAWCAQRLYELDSHKSYLNVFWYLGSLMLGAIAGMAGDKWSLGFVEETEQQVMQHLQLHLERLPEQDKKTAKIIEQMKIDEGCHADAANQAGAAELPLPIKCTMQAISKVMTKTAYYF